MITRTKSLRQYVLLFLLFLGTASFATAQNHDLYGLWVKRAAFGSGGSASITTSILDEQGNVYIAGYFSGILNFSDDLCNAKMFTASAASTGSSFIAKYDPTGKYLWAITGSPTKSTTSIVGHKTTTDIVQYSNNKLLILANVHYRNSMTSVPFGITLTGPINSITHEKSATNGYTGSWSTGNYTSHLLQLVDCATGKLEQTIDIFSTGSSNINATLIGDDLRVVHWGTGGLYPNATSRYTNYSLATNAIVKDIVYPNQPIKGTQSDTRIQTSLSLANGNNVINQVAIDWSSFSGRAWATYYIMTYSSDMVTNQAKIEVDTKVDATYLSTDNVNNIYLTCQYGAKLYAGGQSATGNNVLTNFLGSGKSFATKDGSNKLIISKLKSDLTCDWTFQIGGNSLTNTDVTSAKKMFTQGDYTYVVGSFTGQNVNFDPLGNNPLWLLSSMDYDGFYAVYNNSDGKCVYAVNMGGSKTDSNTALNITPTGNVIIAGTYNSPLLQTDPSGRLYPISSNGTTNQGFVSLYSTNPLSSPIGKASSYGDAPISYGLAVHYVEPCLTLGTFDPAKIQSEPTQNVLANSALNDDALATPLGVNGLVDLNSAGFKLNGNKLELTVKAINNTDTPSNPSGETAFAAAWIDFNQNGVFDTNEGVSGVKLSPSDTQATLIWTNALTQMKHGRTYLRIRLTTDASIDNTQPSGMFFTGDVEDHLLYFNLYELEKSMKLKNRPIDAKAEIGDTILYTLTLKNLLNQQADFKLFDAIPDSTRFTKASDGVTAVTNVTMAGKSVPSVVWNFLASTNPSSALAAGASATRTFEVVVTGKPVTEPHTINNIAFAVRSTDTINSATATCQTWPVVVSGIKAVRDNVSLLPGQSINVPFLKNDIRGACANTPLAKVDTIKSTWGHIGSFVVNKVVSPADTSLVYTPATGKFGIDSLTYYIKCGADSSANKVYLMVHKPLALEYYACDGASVTLGFDSILNVKYNWYSVAIGGTAILNSRKTMTVVKGSAADIGIWWVEPVYNGVKYPRVQAALLLGDCGVISDCGKDGTVIFKEDFGGNELSDPQRAPGNLAAHPLLGKTTYKYVTRTNYLLPNVNEYGLMKNIKGYTNQYWAHPYLDDHTSFGDQGRGYFLTFDASITPGTFYEFEMDALCSGSTLSFSAWLMNINPVSFTNLSTVVAAGYTPPDVKFIIQDENGLILASFSTSDINVETDPKWVNYGFKFTLPAGISKVKVLFINNQQSTNASGYGNDIALDDIEVRFCAPPVITLPAKDTTVCEGDKVELKLAADFVDNNTFGDDLAFRWEHKPQGATAWTSIHSGTSNNGVITIAQSKTTITNIQLADQGYYRFLIASSGNLNSKNCRAVSDSFAIKIPNKLVVPDVRVQLCPDPTLLKVLNLSSYLHPTDTTLTWKVNWKNVSPIPYTPAVDPTTGNVSLAFASGTHTYHYKLENKCGADSARFYVTTLKGSTIQMPPQRVVVCKDMAHSLHIQQMMGVEARGMITSSLDADQTKTHVATINGLPFKGAVLFNGFTAWDDPSVPTFDYHGDDTATKVVFTYTAADDSCLTQKVYTLEVIITENILN